MNVAIRKSALIPAAVASLALAGIVSATIASGSSAATSKPVLRVDGIPTTTLKLMEDSGIFKNAPYKLSTNTLVASDAASALLSGQADLGYFYSGTSVLLQADSGGQNWTQATAPIKVIAGYASPHSLGGIVVRTNSGIKTVAQLKGKKIAWTVGDNGLWLQALKNHGLSASDVTAIQSSEPQDLFEAGSVDAYSGAITSVAAQLANGTAKVLVTGGQVGIPFYPQWATTSKELKNPAKEKLIKDFLVRYTEFNDVWYYKHLSTVRKVLETVGQETAAAVNISIQQGEGTYVIAYNKSLYAGQERTLARFENLGLVKNGVKNIDATFDTQFASVLHAKPYTWNDPPQVYKK